MGFLILLPLVLVVLVVSTVQTVYFQQSPLLEEVLVGVVLLLVDQVDQVEAAEQHLELQLVG
jgi:hypothetical protein